MHTALYTVVRLFSLILVTLLLPISVFSSDSVPSFRREVMAVLSRGGCNQGACHGNLNGKGGFKLSLRGEDPMFDRIALTRDQLGRRTDPLRPAESLLIQKTIGSIPHEGGIRFLANAPEVTILRRWIAAGCPDDPTPLPAIVNFTVTPTEQILLDGQDRVQLTAHVRFSDGTQRDVTNLSVFDLSQEGIVRVSPTGEVNRIQAGDVVVLVRYLNRQVPVRLAFLPARPVTTLTPEMMPSPIDRMTFARFQSLRLQPSARSDDSMFIRRVMLDLTGQIPTAVQAESFLADDRPDKRMKLVDRLLESPAFADFWAMKWADVLRNEEKALDRKGVRVFHGWIRSQIAMDRPLNEFARDLVSGRGSTYEQPAANLYRSLRDPMTRAESVAQVFLGIRLQCARCHNHPFDHWTQSEYHRFTAFFSQVQYRVRSNDRRDKLDQHEFSGDQLVYVDRVSEWPDPRTRKAAKPLFLGGPDWTANGEKDRLQSLAAWIAEPKIPFFAKAQVNRVWYHLFGRGLVEPNDDFRLSNPPSHPEVLDWLAADLASHQFSLKNLIRTIVSTETYQLSSIPNAINAEDAQYHSHSTIRPIAAEPLLDAVSRVLGRPIAFSGYPQGIKAVQLAAARGINRGSRMLPGERFLRVFGQPERLLTCECERSEDPGVLQAFQLMSGELVDGLLTDPDNRIGQLIAAGDDDATMLRTFMLAALTRMPSDREQMLLLERLRTAPDRRRAWEDVVWGMLNAKEFLLRR